MTRTERVLRAAVAWLAVGAGLVAVASCNGLLGLDGYQESACFPEASCPEGTVDSSGLDAEAGDGGAQDATGDALGDAVGESTADVIDADAQQTRADATIDSGPTDGSPSDSSSAFPDGWTADGGAAFGCPQPVSLPGLSGPPVWLPPSPGSTAWRAQLEDPRWAIAPVQPFNVFSGAATQQQALYRYVLVGSTLYVSIQALVDADGIDGVDGVIFGITEGTGGAGAHVFYMQLDTGDSPSPCAAVYHDPAPAPCPVPTSAGLITYYKTLNRGLATPVWTAEANIPAWIENVATWGAGTPNVAWAVTFQIDLTGQGITGNANLFFGAGIQMSPGTTIYLTSSSQSGTMNPAIGPGIPVGEKITDWIPFDASGNTCPTGITITDTSVGVLSGGSLTTSVNTCPIPPNPPGTTCTNVFRVEAQNVPAGAAPFSLRTRIRVADWGSSIADPNAPWIDFGIPPDVFVSQGPFSSPQWVWNQTGGTVDIDYTCAVDLDAGSRYCPALPGSNQPYQSMLVEIAPSPSAYGAPGFGIQTPAVYRNMAFGTLSTLSRQARITLKGLEALTGTVADRDVYLYVETRNMPVHGRAPMALSQSALDEARRTSMSSRLLTGDQVLAQAYPTYRVHVYYDSGRTIVVKGQRQKVLVPMTPFGFYLSHKGTFYGFTHSLEFLDAKSTRIAPNFYRVHVANEGEFHVRTTITAEESPAEELDLPKRPPPRPAAVAAR